MYIPRTIWLFAALFMLPAVPSPGVATEMPEARPGDISIDIGRSGDREWLGYGWSRKERGPAGKFRWIKKLEADVFVEFEWAADMEIWMRAAQLPIEWKRQKVGLYVNGRFITEWLCPPDEEYHDYHAVIPADAWIRGRNRIILRMGYKVGNPNDDRELAIQVARILLRTKSGE